MAVVFNSCAGRATMQSTTSARTRFSRILPSPVIIDVSEPLAITNPARPSGAKWNRKCWIQA